MFRFFLDRLSVLVNGYSRRSAPAEAPGAIGHRQRLRRQSFQVCHSVLDLDGYIL
jgi:hypothetical protein